MRWGTLADIWAGIEAAEAAGLSPIKLNAVVVRGFNEDDVVPLAALTLDRPWHVRFIETMPFGTGDTQVVARGGLVPSAQSRAQIEAELGALEPLPSADPSDEARNYRLASGAGVIGFISPVSEPYCGTCNRMRLTADGRFHLCLLNDDEMDVRASPPWPRSCSGRLPTSQWGITWRSAASPRSGRCSRLAASACKAVPEIRANCGFSP
jgi:cyclic pyranopterin phosphate synthase